MRERLQTFHLGDVFSSAKVLHAILGGRQFNYSEWMGNATAVAISNVYYPDTRDASDNIERLGIALATDAFSQVMKEFWPDVAERLAEEQGIDDDDYERIQRRVLAGRSLVIDPGIHALGWTRQQAEAVAMETGMSKEQADKVIDRIAVEPGQLTSYEIGGLEILSLRESGRRRLGRRFDLRAFHQCVLEKGAVPLQALRANVETCLGVAPAHAQ